MAIDTLVRLGQGRRAAGLGLGYRVADAIAKVAGESLPCLGDDFADTDLALV